MATRDEKQRRRVDLRLNATRREAIAILEGMLGAAASAEDKEEIDIALCLARPIHEPHMPLHLALEHLEEKWFEGQEMDRLRELVALEEELTPWIRERWEWRVRLGWRVTHGEDMPGEDQAQQRSARNWVATLPRHVEWSDYEAELSAAADGALLNYRVRHFPKLMREGDRLFIVWRGEVRGWMGVFAMREAHDPWTCETTGVIWLPGNYIQRTGKFYHLPEPRPKMRGFQGVRILSPDALGA